MDNITDIIKSLTDLSKPDKQYPDGRKCSIFMTDDMKIKVAVIKSIVSGVFEVMLVDNCDDIFKPDIKKAIVYGKNKTAHLIQSLLNGEVQLWKKNAL